MKSTLFVLFGVLVGISAAFSAQPPKAKVNGTWDLTLTAGDLNPPNTAGADFSSTFSSLVSGSGGPITVQIQFGGPTWTVSVSRTTAAWAPGVALSVSIAPPVPPSILIDNSPLTVDAISRAFYQTNNNAALTIYYQMSGVSVVNLSATTYSTVVTFTVVSP